MIERWLIQIGYGLMVLAGFGFLIFVHEFGHFIVAKWKGVTVIKFSLGFGPALFKFRKGETEYALSIIPLGGFCKLAGEMVQDGDKESEEQEEIPPERMLKSKTVGQRAQIFAAGAFLNLLVAFPLGVLMALIGGDAPIAKVEPGASSAFVAGIGTGDLVTSVNGEKVHFWSEMQDAIARAPVKKPFPVTIERTAADGSVQTKTYQMERENESDLFLGLQPYMEIKIGFVHPASPARRAGLKKGDEILSVRKLDGPVVPVQDWQDFESAVRSSPGTQVTLTVRRKNSRKEGGYEDLDIAITPEKETSYDIGIEFGSGEADPIVAAVQGDSPAARAGIHGGDRIVTIDGKEIRKWGDILTAIKEAGLVIPMTLARNGEEVTVTVERTARKGLIGIASSPAEGMIQAVDDGSPAQAAGLLPGDIVTKVDDEPPEGVGRRIVFRKNNKTEHSIEVRRGDEAIVVKVTPQKVTYGKVGVSNSPAMEFRRPESLPAAVSEGVGATASLFRGIIIGLGSLIAGKVETKELVGPVGIMSISYMQAQSSLHDFIRFMLIISISLGVFNLLPVPVLDGGHITFLIIEKIKGKPVTEKTFLVAQYVGLVLLFTLVIFVTKNDVVNFIF